ncbi:MULTISPECIES: MBL fold metallo-hydrolase [Priestia]|uniref:MBL fold metallo-hydrolase n=1 Tax=Priestia megaterium TaxID=1404 RepID=A0AAX6BM63_PRIMG|nr:MULTISPECIES: MBL fold metallo-hydrolase [Priestia]MCA1050786.1 MBL fold metallo-hydrolase [Priestia aryabhattai]MEB4887566.1 MBL fold metallo-hydrolase [Priestia megaterium]MED5117258.1 MBL fold metallo-hydrolase [Priestia megaterium]NGY86824.1 MBL fold metallo-hydrolase [Priestia megaterium]NGY91733.1 MBL fold metallo-hydrolase [Priestia megaterium]
MKITHIRNATLLVEYGGKTFLIDPMLAKKGTYPPFPNSIRQDQNNPLVSLPLSVEEIIEGIDAVILTHLHLDHFDDAAKQALPNDIKMFVQNEEDAAVVRADGFKNVEVLTKNTVFEGIQLSKTKGEHGRGEILKRTGLVCGVVFKHKSKKTLYVAGDTVWYSAVEEEINTHQPDVIIVNGGDNQFLEGGSLVMGKEDIYEVHKVAPHATILSVHMEAVNHWALSREELKSFINEKDMASRVFVPDDGEVYTF